MGNSEETNMVVIQSKVKEIIKEEGLQCSGDFTAAVSDRVCELIEQAINRAKGNDRKTVRPCDL